MCSINFNVCYRRLKRTIKRQLVSLPMNLQINFRLIFLFNLFFLFKYSLVDLYNWIVWKVQARLTDTQTLRHSTIGWVIDDIWRIWGFSVWPPWSAIYLFTYHFQFNSPEKICHSAVDGGSIFAGDSVLVCHLLQTTKWSVTVNQSISLYLYKTFHTPWCLPQTEFKKT